MSSGIRRQLKEVKRAPSQNKSNSKEFRIETLSLAKKLGSHAEKTRLFGIQESLLSSLENKYNFSIEPTDKPTTMAISEAEEISRFDKENEELKKRITF